MTAQVRAAQARPAPARKTEPLAPCPPIGNSCDVPALHQLHSALTRKLEWRRAIIEENLGRIADIRLVQFLLAALDDAWTGDLIAEHALPRLGRLMAPTLRELLERKKEPRFLAGLVAIEKADAADVLRDVLAGGSAELREAAFQAIRLHHLDGFEAAAIEALGKRRTAVRIAAASALGSSSSKQALEALLDAIDGKDVGEAASEALGSCRHPDTVTKILARLKSAKGNKARQLLVALTPHRAPEIAAAALARLQELGKCAALAAINSASDSQLRPLADAYHGEDPELFGVAVKAAFRLQDPLVVLGPAFTARDRFENLGRWRILEVVQHLERNRGDATEAWRSFLLTSLEGDLELAALIADALAVLKETRAIEPLMRAVENTGEDARYHAVAALGELGDPRAIAAIIPCLNDRKLRWHVVHKALQQLRGVEQLRALPRKNEATREMIEALA
jgi:hypothetical protein